MRAERWGLVGALLIGCLIGPYTSFTPALLDVILAAIPLVVSVTLSVLVSRPPGRRMTGLIVVLTCEIILVGLAIAGAAFPAIWQGYSNDAQYISLFAEILLTPFAVVFALGALGTSERTGTIPAEWAIKCAVMSWLGVGIHNVVIPYLVPIVWAAFSVLVLHAQIHSGGFGNALWPIVLAVVVIFISGLYAAGFGVAIIGGLFGAALRTRLMRGSRSNRPSAPPVSQA